MLLACHLDWLPGLHCVLPVVHPPGSLWDPGCSRGVVWILGVSSAGIGGWLLKVAPSESDFCFQNQLLPLKKPWVSAIPRTPAFSSFFSFFFFFFYFATSRISCLLCFATCWKWEGFAWCQYYKWACSFACSSWTAYAKIDWKWSLYNRASKTGCMSTVFRGWEMLVFVLLGSQAWCLVRG